MNKCIRRSSSQVDQQWNNLAELSHEEGTNEEEGDGTTCKICKILCIKLVDKCGDWVQCNICDETSARSAMTREMFPQMMIFCSICHRS